MNRHQKKNPTKEQPINQNSYSYDEILSIGRGEVFGENAPKLPLPDMLMLDRIIQVTEDGGVYGKGQVVAELDIRPDLWFFQCHFQGDPVMPGCLGLDAMWQLSGFFLAWTGCQGKGRALGVKELNFTGQVLPQNKLVRYTIDIKRVIKRKLVLCISDAVMSVDDEDVYKAEGLRVGLFTEEE